MKNGLLEISCRQFGSASRTHIVINKLTVNISGQGGQKRDKFNREETTPDPIWNQLITETDKFKPGEIPVISKPGKRTKWGNFGLTIKTTTNTEQSELFSNLDPPEQLKLLLKTIFSAQSPLEAIIYTENGMSESLMADVRRDKANINRVGGGDDKSQIDIVTPADFWESLCVEVSKIEVENIYDMISPTNRRAADVSLYARIKVKFNGEWYESKSFDDDKPPEPLRHLVRLMKSSGFGSFKEYGQTRP